PVATPECRPDRCHALGGSRDDTETGGGRPRAPRAQRSRSADPQPLFLIERTVKHSVTYWSVLLTGAALVAACTSPVNAPVSERASAAPLTMLAFGDTGYHYDYLAKKEYQRVVTQAQFEAKERKSWIEDKRPIEELAYPPTHQLPNGSVIA